MAIMMGRLRAALVAGGTPENMADEAATGAASYETRLGGVEGKLTNLDGRMSNVETRLSSVDSRVAGLDARVSVLTWMVTFNIGLTITVLFKLFH